LIDFLEDPQTAAPGSEVHHALESVKSLLKKKLLGLETRFIIRFACFLCFSFLVPVLLVVPECLHRNISGVRLMPTPILPRDLKSFTVFNLDPLYMTLSLSLALFV
jgi:hypothetical protein